MWPRSPLVLGTLGASHHGASLPKPPMDAVFLLFLLCLGVNTAPGHNTRPRQGYSPCEHCSMLSQYCPTMFFPGSSVSAFSRSCAAVSSSVCWTDTLANPPPFLPLSSPSLYLSSGDYEEARVKQFAWRGYLGAHCASESASAEQRRQFSMMNTCFEELDSHLRCAQQSEAASSPIPQESLSASAKVKEDAHSVCVQLCG